MDLILSVMSTGTCFTEKHVRRWHRLPSGVNSNPPCYTRNHITKFPAEPGVVDHVSKASRVIVPVRDPVLSLITGMRKGDNMLPERIRGWLGILALENEKFQYLPIDIHEPLRSEYAARLFPGMLMDWDDMVNTHRDAQNKFNTVRDLYVERGDFPKLPFPTNYEWEKARPKLQDFLERLGYQPLSWWR